MSDDTAVIEQPSASVEPVSQPATTPAPEAPPAAPAAPTPATTPRDPEQALRDAVGKQMDKVPGFEVTKPAAKTPEQIAAEQKLEADKKAPAAPVQTPEEKAAADKKAAAEEKAAAEAKAAEAKPEPNPLDKIGPLPVETLAKAINENPELASALEKAGIDSELLYETSRRAALTDQFTEIFPTPESAQFAAENAQHFYDIEEGFPKIETLQDFDGYVTNTLLPLSVLYDPVSGKPLMNPDGRGYQTDGSIEKFFSRADQMTTLMRDRQADALLKSYANVPGEEGERLQSEAQAIKEAVILAQNFQDAGYKIPGSKQPPAQRSAEDQALIDQAAKDRAESFQRNADAKQKEDSAYQETVFTEAASVTVPFVQRTLDGTSLSDTEKRLIAKEALSETWDALKNNRHFQAQKQHLFSLGNTAEAKKSIISLTQVAFETQATKVLRRMVEEAGGKQISKSQAKLQKIDSQISNDRMNQGTGTTPIPKPAATLTSQQVRAKAIENYKARNHGAMPDDGEILTESLAIRGLGQKSA